MSSAAMRSNKVTVDGESPAGNKAARWLLILLAVAALLFFIAWLLGAIRFRTDPRIAEIQKLQAEAQQQFMANGGPQTLEEAKAAVAAMGQIREKIEALPESMQLEAGRRGANVFRSMMQTRINAYFSLPPEQRQAELDRQIKQEELFRKAWEAARPTGRRGGPSGGVAAGAGPGVGAAGGGSGEAGGTAGGGGAGAGASGGGPGGGGGGPGGRGFGGPPRNGTEEERNRWRKNMIDSTTPEQRARYVEYRRAMEARREQLGMPPAGPR